MWNQVKSRTHQRHWYWNRPKILLFFGKWLSMVNLMVKWLRVFKWLDKWSTKWLAMVNQVKVVPESWVVTVDWWKSSEPPIVDSTVKNVAILSHRKFFKAQLFENTPCFIGFKIHHLLWESKMGTRSDDLILPFASVSYSKTSTLNTSLCSIIQS